MLKAFLNNIIEWSILFAGIILAIVIICMIMEVPQWTGKLANQIKELPF
jgi:hypothetical protein